MKESKFKIGKYKHYKGGIVKAINVAHHSETLEELVIYKVLYECRTFGKGSIWVRPKKTFLEKLVIDGKKVSRFKYIGK